MRATFDSALMRPGDREETIRHAIWNSVVKVDIDHHVPPAGMDAKVGLAAIGCIAVCSVLCTGATVRRTPRLAREDEEPSVFLGLQLSGTSLVVQNGREALLKSGDFALYDTTAPYTLAFDSGVNQHFLRFPRAALALPERTLRDATAVTFGADDPVAALASTYFSRLAGSEELRHGPGASVTVAPSVELVRAVLASRMGDSYAGHGQALEESLAPRIMEYIRVHLRESDLSATRIAAAHAISVRRLYTLLSRSGISLGDWIRSQRLEGCGRELAAASAASRTVASVGRGWGFTDATHFSKVFKHAYGVTPGAWRDHHRRTPPA
ncbi:helix-turn-helix domain-containing protein [Streptomyces tsukubensis]|uniref:AraC family transcriptional regulator n=1 Tax=Streptomyces tsukubensis TaxID=83656 RepID=A0A1V4AA72_9ACTN|nr:helix-turn-helix domain-containing protein [Streptomyces tsukubensis]OON80062.1 AraC family transcriptional regulator [Streptomyces tsukubensis]QFR97294.1 helix-turn-helix domain-containing protein [Streptomyces tsukubensis]